MKGDDGGIIPDTTKNGLKFLLLTSLLVAFNGNPIGT